jgi:hypothetical protein
MMRRFIAATALLVSSSALAAPPLPPGQWDEAARHTLARTLVAEADWHTPDHAAIAHVLVKRWRIASGPRGLLHGIRFEDFVREYSALWKPEHTNRKRGIRALPWGPFPERSQWGGGRWDVVRKWVEKWGTGRVNDPCPKALHWGGTMDRPAGHWHPVSCGRTRNIFYLVRTTHKRPS